MRKIKLMLITESEVLEFLPKSNIEKYVKKTKYNLRKKTRSLNDEDECTPKKLYTVTQIMELFGTSRPTIYSWIKKKILKPIYIGGRVYFKPDDIDILIEDRLNSL